MRRAVLALFLVSLAAEAQFRESIEVRLVELDVVVTDRQGNRVHGLKPEDFEVYDTRTLQKITNFTEYGPAAPTGVAPAASAGGSSDAPRQPQNFLLLIDTLPRTFLVRAQTFAKIARLLDKLMTNGDRVSLVKWDRGFDRAEPLLSTNDRAEVMRTLRKIAGVEANAGHAEIAAAQSDVEKQFLNGIDARSMINVDAQFESSGYFSGELTRMSFQRKMRAMKQLVQSLAAGPGRKTVLYVANGFSIATRGPEHLTGLAAIEDVVRAANAGRVTFYAVTPVINDDPEAMDTRMGEANALQNLTLPTGGTYDFGVGGVEKVATSIAEDASAYYSIAYQTRSDGRDRARNV
ncbi:MAG TPA: VWA domain-containing protein [Thermoanaerobaculia bacterium]|nr:VWA domain-containing protein [Thermoanaerobaculia bacterium]